MSGLPQKIVIPKRTEAAPSFLAFDMAELESLPLSPPAIVEDYLYGDVSTLFAAGGTGKTTLTLYEGIHIALGRPLYGRPIPNPGTSAFVTAEDPRGRMGARLWRLMKAMELTADEMAQATARILVWDVVGLGKRLVLNAEGNLVVTSLADEICRHFGDDPPRIPTFDPLISFGADESRVNDNEDRLIEAARRIMRRQGCCVRLVHHTGKGREGNTSQYVGRGGSALSDGARMVHVLTQARDIKEVTAPSGFDGPECIALARPKISYTKPGLLLIFLRREGWAFSYAVAANDPETRRAAGREKAEREARKAREIVLTFVQDRERNHQRTPRTLVRESHGTLGMSRASVESALSRLLADGTLVEVDLPPNERRGRGTTHFVTASAFRQDSETPSAECPPEPPSLGEKPFRQKHSAAYREKGLANPSVDWTMGGSCRKSPTTTIARSAKVATAHSAGRGAIDTSSTSTVSNARDWIPSRR